MRCVQVASFAFVVCVAAAAAVSAAQELVPDARQGWQIAGAFPRSEPGPLERRARPVTPENPIPRRTRFVRPPYPTEAAAVGAIATVTLRITVDHLGTVGEVRSVGVPVLGAISPDTLPDQRAFTAGLFALVQSAKDAAAQWLYEPPADAPIAFDVVVSFRSGGDGEVIAQSAPRSPEVSVPRPTDGGSLRVASPTKVKHVNPIYPAAAREAKIAGIVIVEASIGTDGRVADARVLRSIPELDEAALDAVKQWEFTPVLTNGVATPYTMTLTIQFSLQ